MLNLCQGLAVSKNLLISAFADDAAGEHSLFQGRWWLMTAMNYIHY